MRSFHFLFLILILLVSGACSSDPSKPGYEIKALTDMMRPVPYESYSKNEVFKDGLTLQTPVEGTVYRGAIIDNPFAVTPVALSKADLSRGQFVYENYCLVCHGATGAGDGPILPRYPNPPDYQTAKLMGMPPEQIFQSVSNGIRSMPAHAAQIDEMDRWRVVYYVMSLQGRVK